MQDKIHGKPGRRFGRLRLISFHFGAVLVVLSPLVFLEVVVRLFVAAPEIQIEDPYVSFSGLSPLFVLNEENARFETAEGRLDFFPRQSFSAAKDPKTLRIFSLGGSTVQGRPYSVESSFTTWLALNVNAARPGMGCEVVNCGGISYASYRLVPILRELLAHEPDLFIIYTGHNEFLEDRTYRDLKRMPRLLTRAHRALLSLSSYSHAYQLLSIHRAQSKDTHQSEKAVLPAEVLARLDFQDGLKSYHRDEAWRQGTISHFRHNLDRMIRMCTNAGVPVILVNPVSNLKDCPPFKSEYTPGLSDDRKRRVLELYGQAQELDWSDTYGKIRLLERAVSIDSRHAGLLYMLGKCYARLGRWVEARKWFTLAKEQDICPLRILEPMHEAIRDIGVQYQVPVVDVNALIKERTEGGVPGNEWLLDHVHPSIAGHQLIADAIYDAMEDMELLRTPAGWRADREDLWRDHLLSLGSVYYARGVDRLKSLNVWSRGIVSSE